LIEKNTYSKKPLRALMKPKEQKKILQTIIEKKDMEFGVINGLKL